MFNKYDCHSFKSTDISLPHPYFHEHLLFSSALYNMDGASDSRARRAQIFLIIRAPCGSQWEALNTGVSWMWGKKEKKRSVVWVWFLSSLIFTAVIQFVSQTGIFSASLNVMIFMRTCPHLLYVSYSIWHHCPRYRVVFTYD